VNAIDKKPLTVPPEIVAFLEGIIDDSGMGKDLAPDVRDEMIKELFARLDSYITSTIIEHLPKEKVEEFAKMAQEGKSREEVEQYLKNTIPNSQEVFNKAFENFRNLYLEENKQELPKDMEDLAKGNE
jgi:hypothetical protein